MADCFIGALSDFHMRMYLRYALFVLADLVMTLIGLFVIPVGLGFCIRDQHTGKDVHMPRLFWPWDNEWDGVNYLETGTGFWQRWRWLALRNHTRNFGAYVLGIRRPYKFGSSFCRSGEKPDRGPARWQRQFGFSRGDDFKGLPVVTLP